VAVLHVLDPSELSKIVCTHCNQRMMPGKSCIKIPIYSMGKLYNTIPYGQDNSMLSDMHVNCPGCGVRYGGYHHPGCYVEKCPVCDKQLFVCDCLTKTTESQPIKAKGFLKRIK